MINIYYKPLISLLTGLFLVVFWVARTNRRKKIIANCEETTGTIIDENLTMDHNGSKMYYPIIQFKTSTNELIKKKYSEGSFPAKYKVLQDVTVQYLVTNPRDFIIKGEKKTFDILILCLGIGFIGYSIFLFYNI